MCVRLVIKNGSWPEHVVYLLKLISKRVGVGEEIEYRELNFNNGYIQLTHALKSISSRLLYQFFSVPSTLNLNHHMKCQLQDYAYSMRNQQSGFFQLNSKLGKGSHAIYVGFSDKIEHILDSRIASKKIVLLKIQIFLAF